MDKKGIGKFIKQLREERSWTQLVLADKLQESYADATDKAVSKWECGNIPNIENLIKLAKLFGVSIDELLKGERFPEQINWEEIYYISDMAWHKKCQDECNGIKEKLEEYYNIRERQGVQIKKRFDELIIKQINDKFSFRDKSEFDFLVSKFYEVSQYALDKISKFGNILKEDEIKTLYFIKNKLITEIRDGKVEEVQWEIKKLYRSKTLGGFITIQKWNVDQYDDDYKNVDRLKNNIKNTEDWEKDMLLAFFQTEDYKHYDMFGGEVKYFNKHNKRFDNEKHNKLIIKLLVECGAMLNESLLGFYHPVEIDGINIVDRLEEIYNKYKKPILTVVTKCEEGNNETTYKYIENNGQNRVFKRGMLNYYLKDFYAQKLIARSDLYRLLMENKEPPDDLLINMYMADEKFQNKKKSDNRDEILANATSICEYEQLIKTWKEYHDKELLAIKELKEYDALLVLLNSGQTILTEKKQQWYGGKVEKLEESFIIEFKNLYTYETYKNTREKLKTKQLLNEIDSLTLDEIRAKYFVREV